MRRSRLGSFAAVALTFSLTACDVVNPGRVLEADLDNPDALQAVVNGVVGELQDAYNSMGPSSTVMAGELLAASFSAGIYYHWQGRPSNDDAESYDILRALPVIADNAIDRIQRVLGAEAESAEVLADAYLWAGFVNRVAGDHYCNAVIDGSASQSRAVYHERAVDRFTDAIAVATTVGRDDWVAAAHAGRAHSAMQLGDWTTALADAALIQDPNFRFNLPVHSLGNERNVIYQNTYVAPHMGARWTWAGEYSDNYDDARMSYVELDEQTSDGSFPTTFAPEKYDATTDPIALTKAAEMRLIEAEYAITEGGDWAGGMQIINDLRLANGQLPWVATNQTEAFEALKYERAIVLWLELRRLGDLWRWGNTAAGDPILQRTYELAPPPGQFPGSSGGLVVAIEDRAICFPFSRTLEDTNPNL